MKQGYEIGIVPPQALDMEVAVLGAILLERDALLQVTDILQERSFYKESHGRIFGAVHRLNRKSEPVDILTVTEELHRTGELESVGGAYFISQLTNGIGSSANVEFHARIVAEKFLLRELIRVGSDAVRMGFDESHSDVFGLLDRVQNEFFKIEKTFSGGQKVQSLRELLRVESGEYIAQEQRAHARGVVGVETGFIKLNQITGGWREPDLIIIAARPAMGKTSLALALALAAAKSGVNVLFFSLEMSALQLVKRLVQSESEVNSYGYRNATLSPSEVRQLEIVRGQLEDLGIYFDDTAAITLGEYRSKARQAVQKNNVGLVLVDYLQLMTTGEDKKYGSSNREREISTISSTLKRTCKELNVPTIALSQLSRAVETRGGDKIPQLSDLRESGAIEQDADLVIFIHRPEYYNITQDSEGNSTTGVAQLIVSKHRNGPLGTVQAGFVDRYTKFWDRDAQESQQFPGQLQPHTEFITENTNAPHPLD